ncbi:MAG TPA: sigma-54-dependent Fis family transcriptional regulator [Myxococcales bacterium LLY-WYZ-16_1]|nr:sigma-54-dependent Fis family transcriptional regulator [Myxococcales bacterium LLY-WYZ-16_1]
MVLADGGSLDETVDGTAAGATGEGSAPEGFGGRLVLVHPRWLEARIEIGDETLEIGRTDGPLRIPVPHPTLSRRHVRVDWDPRLRTHAVLDLGSKNSTRVDGRRLLRGWEPLQPGSIVRTGDVLWVYEAGHEGTVRAGVQASRSALPGEALAMLRLRAEVARAARDTSAVLITGETGTGKEWVAREIHRASGRPGEWVPVNAAALSDRLMESQLFGHAKGAFTGAISDQPGLFGAAAGGTLFLDEIGELPLELQPKLLRAIQEREILPVGSTKPVPVDVRVVAATHRDLEARVREGKFRQDLLARLSLWRIHVPALRQRKADLFAWFERLQARWFRDRGIGEGPLTRFHPHAAEALLQFDWPDNLRGLDRLVHALEPSAEPVRSHQLPDWLRTGGDSA